MKVIKVVGRVIGIFLLVVITCGILGYQVLFKRCLFSCAPSRSFSVTELGLPAHLFPDKEDVGEMHNTYDSTFTVALEQGRMSVHGVGIGRVNYSIYRQGSEVMAMIDYAMVNNQENFH